MNIKIPEWSNKILQVILLLFTTLILGGILVSGLKIYRKQSSHISLVMLSLIFICAILGIVISFGIFWLLAKLPDNQHMNRIIIISLLTFFAVIFIAWIYITPIKQKSDYWAFWHFAKKMVKGKAIYHHRTDYFAKWAYQTGFLTYVTVVVKLFGRHIRIIQLLNVGFQLIILFLTYSLTQKLFHKVVLSRWSLFLLGSNIEWFALNNRVTNQYLGLIFFLLTLILIIDDHPFNWIISGITLAIANYLRPLGIVFILGIIVFWLIYRFIALPKIKLKSISKLCGFLIVYGLCMFAFNSSIKQTGLNQYGISNPDNNWKFVVGLNYHSTGRNTKHFIKFDRITNWPTRQKREKKVIKQNINHLNKHHLWLSLFIKKFWSMWSYPSNSLGFSLFYKNHSKRSFNFLLLLAFAINSFQILLAFFGAISCLGKQIKPEFCLLLLVMFAYAAAHLLIEIQGRYRIEFTPIIVIIATLGLEIILKYFSSWRQRSLK